MSPKFSLQKRLRQPSSKPLASLTPYSTQLQELRRGKNLKGIFCRANQQADKVLRARSENRPMHGAALEKLLKYEYIFKV